MRRLADTAPDIALGAGLAALVLTAGLFGWGPPGPTGALDPGALALALVAGGAVAVRRRFPVACLVVVNLATAAWFHAYPGRLITAGPLIGCYTLAAHRGWRAGVAGGLATAVVTVLTVRFALDGEWLGDQVFNAVPLEAAATALGAAVHSHRAFAAGARERAERIAQSRSDQARRQAAEERLEIARELHDVFGHTMAAISVQAGVATHIMGRQPERATEALHTIKRISDEGLTEVSVLLGLMRSADPRTAAGGLARLDKLLDTAGVRVDLVVRGADRAVPVAVDLAAFRIVQESLTNVRRHARATAARVELTYGDVLEVVVRDNGTGGGSAATAVGGHGIEGMRARAEKLGGTLTAGPVDGGFEVRCALPVQGEPGGDR
ncbi:sensor histidine kinase [Goodfellowiella coeruleoviolacea]|uniref:histidine kinase n=1 Tax=Goodfellowiella coeruleoviolacea TaxID=334858 RepID=A0AAE3KE54_9PSEU|nr:histidine kinase [Goodfellowiella coeruleoviolacea]MCP2164931.1 Histidine kinase [Goodfellowiella coeruleoviolacea]